MSNESKTELCMGTVELKRTSGTFTKDNGEVIAYKKYVVEVDGAEIDVSFDKSVKNLVERFVPFEEVAEA